MSIGLTSALAAFGGGIPLTREAMRTKPTPHSAVHHESTLLEGLDRYVNKHSPNNPLDLVARKPTEPTSLLGAVKSTVLGGATTGDAGYRAHFVEPDKGPGYKMNLNGDASILAHELGHISFGQTQVGDKVQRTRDFMQRNPKLAAAFLASGALIPAGIAASVPGDDDLAGGLAIAGAMAAPALVDEFEATRRGFDIMKESGVTPSKGSRARMAGGYLTYAAAPLLLASGGNLLGNQFDADLQTDSTMMPE